MANDFNITDSIWNAFVSFLFTSGSISVSEDFHQRCKDIETMLDNDTTGIISTLVDYSVNSASEAKLKIECSNDTLEQLLSVWLERININIDGVPTGLQELAKEYYKERWAGSSLCLLKVADWKEIKAGNNSITAPTTLWFYNGASAYIKRPNPKDFKLGTDEYYKTKEYKMEIVKANENLIVQKPGASRWYTLEPSPYLIRKGIYKNYRAIEVLQSKGDETITKALPYLLQMIKGTESAFIQKNQKFTTEQLEDLRTKVKTKLKRYQREKGEVPLATTPFDEEWKHIIPDLLPIVREELFRQGYRALLAGFGFVDMLEIAPSRQETRLNPKPFIAEVNDGVDGFKSILKEVIYLIIDKNKEYHTKFFSDNISLKIVNNPLRINLDQIREMIRSVYDRGNLSKRAITESIGFDYDQEKQRRRKEFEDGDEELMYPHIINNQEDKGIDIVNPSKPKKENNEDQNKKKNSPEGNNYKNSELEEDLEIAPYKNVEELLKKHPYMKKYPKGALEVFIEVFNKSLPKGEDYAFPVAYTAMKRWLKKHGYKKVNDKWVKSESENV